MRNILFLSIGMGFPSLSGWAGTISYLSAYLLLSMNRLKADQRLYHVLNILGAIGLTYNAVFLNDFPNIIVNVVWGVIACWAIFAIARRKQN
ncbi:MAG: hypothetical protein P4L51_07975 [Puia sp.]|nr:hypothetical protein [Puia sp.]